MERSGLVQYPVASGLLVQGSLHTDWTTLRSGVVGASGLSPHSLLPRGVPSPSFLDRATHACHPVGTRLTGSELEAKEIQGSLCMSGPSFILRRGTLGRSKARGTMDTGQSRATGWWGLGALGSLSSSCSQVFHQPAKVRMKNKNVKVNTCSICTRLRACRRASSGFST